MNESEDWQFPTRAWLSLVLGTIALGFSIYGVFILNWPDMKFGERAVWRFTTRVFTVMTTLWAFCSFYWVINSYEKRNQNREKEIGKKHGLKDVSGINQSLEEIDLDRFLGKFGVVTSTLRPEGKVRIDGQELNARCKNGLIDTDEKVMVTGKYAFGLLVKLKLGATTNPLTERRTSVQSG